LTHEEEATKNLFEMTERYHDLCPEPFKPHLGASSSKEMSFDRMDSDYKVGTAGNKATGRSGTTQFFHGSEVAFWPHADQHAMGVMQTIPRSPGTEIWLESTANGIGNYFHIQWQKAERGETDFIPVFLPWYWQDEYRIKVAEGFRLTEEEADLLSRYGHDGLTVEHLNWRRIKIAELSASGTGDDGEWRFRQEYPFTAAEAFQTSDTNSLISSQDVVRARGRKIYIRGPKIVGLDPSRFGDDEAVFSFRQGRSLYRQDVYQKRSTMELAGIAANLLRNPVTGEPTDIDMMFVDVGGLGAGVYDRLVELGFEEEGRICAVNFGGKANEPERYVNKRAEMWCLSREWLAMGASIPDDDVLQGEACGPTYSYDSLQRIKLERKEDMRKRGISSPNRWDAHVLTFAHPVVPKTELAKYRHKQTSPGDPGVGY
jgi:hypothetical protein